ncbi:MAG: nucleotidyltransferase domain-containing protein [Dehalococcoidia bacterium]
MSTTHEAALDLARAIAGELMREPGALAVWLAGSHARGDAGPYSDLDLGVIADGEGRGPGYRLSRRDGVLVSVSWGYAERTRASFDDPAVLGAAVPGWRNAVILADPDGIANALRGVAANWRWTDAREAICNDWVAEQITGYAEEVQKLLNARARGWPATEAVQRSVLALRLPWIMSVHHRLLYDSENGLWAAVAGTIGEPWASTQACALGTTNEDFEAQTRAALRLYVLAAGAVRRLLDDRQRAVVDPAIEAAMGLLE